MPLTPLFSITQNTQIPNTLNFTDTSTGTDVAVTARRIYLQKYDASYLVPTGTSTSYISWIISAPTIAVNALDKDYALNITVQWLDVSGNVLYTKTVLYVFSAYVENALYGLTQLQVGNPMLVSDKNYYANKMKLRVCIDDANQAATLATDQTSAQLALDKATFLTTNKTYFF